ncbi:hypothetical protein L0Y65_01510 [Candidatus Micrarchaeota archaeon]|nr:hypothetical protein [Candidatus Micrarchaeota archaeon]
MGEVFESTIRPLGSSACVLIPKEQLEEKGLKIGDKIEVALIRHRDPAEIEQAFGMAKDFTEPFARDKKTREF